MSGSAGTIQQLQISLERRAPMNIVGVAHFRAGHGIDGDRRAGQGGNLVDRQVLLMDTETQEELGIDPSATRENVTTRGLELSALSSGQRVRLGGTAVIEVTGECAPCSLLNRTRPGLKDELAGRRGVLGRVVEEGSVQTGDPIVVEG